MSSGRPSTSLARLSRALLISSFAFLPVGWDPAAPPWAPGRRAQPSPAATAAAPVHTCGVGAAGVAPGLAHGVPHGLRRLRGQGGGGVVVQVDTPVGRRRVRGCRGREGNTGPGRASPLGRIAPRLRRLRTGSHRRRHRPRPPPWHRGNTPVGACGGTRPLPCPPHRGGATNQRPPSFPPSWHPPISSLLPPFPTAMTPGPPSNLFCPGWAAANQLPLILAAHTAPAHWPVDPEPAARPIGCRRDPSSSSSRRQGPRPRRALTLSRRSLLLPARPILARCHRAGRKGQARGGAHFRRAPGVALPGEGGREPPRRCPSSRWRRQPRPVPPAPSCAGSADPPPRWW